MKLIELSCPNCHANLEVDGAKKEFTCKYCRTKTLLDDEVIKVEHTITDKKVLEKIKVAKTYLNDFQDYKKAFSKFKAISEEHPYEPEVWWGLILCMTKNFAEIEFDYDNGISVNTSLCNDYFNKYLKVEKDTSKKEKNTKEYTEYINKLKNNIKEKINDILNIEDYNEAYNILENLSKINSYESEVWWGLILYITENFSDKDLDYRGDALVDISLCDEYFDKYLEVEKDDEQKESNTNKYLAYKEELNSETEEAKDIIEDYEEYVSKIIVITIIALFSLAVIFLIIRSLAE